MTTITGITDQSPQTMAIQLPDGSTVTWTLTYRPNQYGWFYDISWDGQTPAWEDLGNRLVTSPNILRQFKNILPFGISIVTPDGGEPTGQEDFADGYATAVLLDAVDLLNIEATYFPGN